MNECFAIIGKAPVPGLSKTRLAKDIGEERAVQAYKMIMEYFFIRLSREIGNRKLFFFYTPDNEYSKSYFNEALSLFNPSNVSMIAQPETAFFSKLSWMFKYIYDQEGETRVHLTGTDIPDFPLEVTDEPIDQNQCLIGPDNDGGFYYLQAFSSDYEALNIDNIVKDGDVDVLEAMKNSFISHEKTPLFTQTWSDIDNLEDLKTSINRSPELSFLNRYL